MQAPLFFFKIAFFELIWTKKIFCTIIPLCFQTNHSFNHSAIKTLPLYSAQLINRKILNYVLTKKLVVTRTNEHYFLYHYKKITAFFRQKTADFHRMC